jgi:parallel beta-helix repeat protein
LISVQFSEVSASSEVELKIEVTQDYVAHNPIIIKNNSDFEAQAQIEGWTGDGSQASPYIIQGYDLSNSTNVIEISDTDVYFTITGNSLKGVSISVWPDNGISLWKVKNGNITQNTIQNFKFGISLYESHNTTIAANTINKNIVSAMWLRYSDNNTIKSNIVTDNSEGYGKTYRGAQVCGMVLFYSDYNIVFDNTIQDNHWDGLFLPRSSNNIITNNTISGHTSSGINMIEGNNQELIYTTCSNNIISHNSIYLNTWGIGLRGDGNVISDNSIYQNGIGIFLGLDNYKPTKTDDTTYTIAATNTELSDNVINNNSVGVLLENSQEAEVIDNSIYFNSEYGVSLNSPSSSNSIANNDFVANNLDEDTNTQKDQAVDNGSSNSFLSNYWYEWTSPDSDGDGIVDNPYSIAGETETTDPSPLALPNNANTPQDITAPPSKSSPGWTIAISIICIILITNFRRRK